MSFENGYWEDPRWTNPTIETCDDCEEEYLGPVYYEFDAWACYVDDSDTGEQVPHGVDCTGNLCPSCAQDLEPWYSEDPRRMP